MLPTLDHPTLFRWKEKHLCAVKDLCWYEKSGSRLSVFAGAPNGQVVFGAQNESVDRYFSSVSCPSQFFHCLKSRYHSSENQKQSVFRACINYRSSLKEKGADKLYSADKEEHICCSHGVFKAALNKSCWSMSGRECVGLHNSDISSRVVIEVDIFPNYVRVE